MKKKIMFRHKHEIGTKTILNVTHSVGLVVVYKIVLYSLQLRLAIQFPLYFRSLPGADS
jgi:hypothetical protein